ncbi:hypothetical protein BDQ12DRAFT_682414 [Crucibulum laeve]|uniref:Uncharacterized protein n=1 Tax=Crucibulum laeve TaxID=68775 RepID=A0A5C3MDK9_9AGAR|nr:hypothetical protein BDQ12DRAFT_682414 [Crucibulum laeve]
MAILEPSRCPSPLAIPQEKDTGPKLSNFSSQISFPSMVFAHEYQHATSETSPGIYQHQRPSNGNQPPPTPRHAFASTGLPPAYATSALHPILASASDSKVIYRPFPPALPEHQSVPAVIVPGDIPLHLFLVRFSHAPGDYKMLAFPTGASFTSLNDVLNAVRDAVASTGTEPKPEELGETKEGRVRLDGMGGWMWTGFVLGDDGVWELSLV